MKFYANAHRIQKLWAALKMGRADNSKAKLLEVALLVQGHIILISYIHLWRFIPLSKRILVRKRIPVKDR